MTKTAEEVIAEWDAEQIRKKNAMYYAEFRGNINKQWYPLKEMWTPCLFKPENIVGEDLEAVEESVMDQSRYISNLVRIRQLDTIISLWERGKCIWSASE